MKFGLLFRPQDPPNAANIGRRWAETLDAAEAAEVAGFDGVFVPEHHMMPDGYLPAPMVACGALAARTKRVDVGTTVFLLPYYNPIQVAEQAAMVDVISGGRMRLGCGLGALPEEFALYGLDAKTQISRFEEAIGLVQQAWSGPSWTTTASTSPPPGRSARCRSRRSCGWAPCPTAGCAGRPGSACRGSPTRCTTST